MFERLEKTLDEVLELPDVQAAMGAAPRAQVDSAARRALG